MRFQFCHNVFEDKWNVQYRDLCHIMIVGQVGGDGGGGKGDRTIPHTNMRTINKK